MKIISWNVNGLRANYKKGFLDWFKNAKADIVCLQEIRSNNSDLPEELRKISGYNLFLNPAQKSGYSGTAIYTKQTPIKETLMIDLDRFDKEGRIIQLDFPEFILINLYLPHGGRQKENLDYKLEAYDYLLNCLKTIKSKKVVVVGDFNIAHQEIDLARPKDNKNNTMFTTEERERIDEIIKLGFIDSFRKFNNTAGNYTWWPYLANARERNIGWRIDYCFASALLEDNIKGAFILNKVMGSDHCPVGIEITL
ncbi:exodeoxyribonuclease III [Patescibacteria group bacterium]|nr:exodeoxyribonuclease III [Patescibacteria group bacterium]MBU4162120.1 exodeoxyribonuclease III [Patescibacteria group bacterium]